MIDLVPGYQRSVDVCTERAVDKRPVEQRGPTRNASVPLVHRRYFRALERAACFRALVLNAPLAATSIDEVVAAFVADVAALAWTAFVHLLHVARGR